MAENFQNRSRLFPITILSAYDKMRCATDGRTHNMSRLEFDVNANQYLVKLPRINKLPPNPLIGPAHEAWARACVPPSDTSQADSESQVSTERRKNKSIRHLLLACDQRSFLTGSAVAGLQVARILNTVRNDETRKTEDVVSICGLNLLIRHLIPCFRKHILPSSISFWHLSAILFGWYYQRDSMCVHPKRIPSIDKPLFFPVEESLWNCYGTYCFVPAEDDIIAMLDTLRKGNAKWKTSLSMRKSPAAFKCVSLPPNINSQLARI